MAIVLRGTANSAGTSSAPTAPSVSGVQTGDLVIEHWQFNANVSPSSYSAFWTQAWNVFADDGDPYIRSFAYHKAWAGAAGSPGMSASAAYTCVVAAYYSDSGGSLSVFAAHAITDITYASSITPPSLSSVPAGSRSLIYRCSEGFNTGHAMPTGYTMRVNVSETQLGDSNATVSGTVSPGAITQTGGGHVQTAGHLIIQESGGAAAASLVLPRRANHNYVARRYY